MLFKMLITSQNSLEAWSKPSGSRNVHTVFSRFKIESDSNTLKITGVEELFLSKNTGGKYISSKPVGYHSELNL